MFAEYVVFSFNFAELVVLQCVWLQIVLNLQFLWCEWLQFTLIGLLSTECVTSMYVLEFDYMHWGLTTIYHPRRV